MNEKVKAFLAFLEKGSDKNKLKKVYYRPTKGKCIIGLIFTVIFMLLLLFMCGFRFQMIFLLLFIADFMLIVYYAVNLFTEEGFLLPKYVEEEDKDNKYQFK